MKKCGKCQQEGSIEKFIICFDTLNEIPICSFCAISHEKASFLTEISRNPPDIKNELTACKNDDILHTDEDDCEQDEDDALDLELFKLGKRKQVNEAPTDRPWKRINDSIWTADRSSEYFNETWRRYQKPKTKSYPVHLDIFNLHNWTILQTRLYNQNLRAHTLVNSFKVMRDIIANDILRELILELKVLMAQLPYRIGRRVLKVNINEKMISALIHAKSLEPGSPFSRLKLENSHFGHLGSLVNAELSKFEKDDALGSEGSPLFEISQKLSKRTFCREEKKQFC